ncbi:PEP/pyruvate-binding domain-containing protein, partial [Nocardia sp. NPDC058497]|uniref:PEP/pyruvate-binding domain-containing protein n=1 Tax=Nocardia sp. NPDC058497 TaxID=3346529 RepID=UPI00365C0C28
GVGGGGLGSPGAGAGSHVGTGGAALIDRHPAPPHAPSTEIGGKAAGLVRLLAAGLPVPEAWVVPTRVSRDATLAQQCLRTELPAWWAAVTGQFPGSRWAVRSSAVAEDMAGASFAGVYDTVLGVDSAQALTRAVEKCWESLGRDRAANYLGAQGMDSAGGIAVVLQRMIEADTAGVMLTENPLAPFDDHLVIDAAWGLGEAVVSGHTEPDHLVVGRDSGAVLSTRIGAKHVESVWDEGLVARAVAPDRRDICCLNPAQVGALHTLAGKVGATIGPRRDLEWAIEQDRLYVLQDRPITGLPPRQPQQVWSRRFGDEYLAEYTTPLGHDLMNGWLAGPNIDEVAELQGRPEITALQKFRRHEGHIYLNGEYALELVKVIPKKLRAGGPPVAWFDPVFGQRLLDAPFEPKLLLRMLFAPLRDTGRGGPNENLAALVEHCAALDARLAPKLRQDYTALTDHQWRTQFAEADTFGRDHFRVIRWGMGHYGPLLHGLLAKLAGSGESGQVLISGLPGTKTAEINRDLWDLSLIARRHPGLLTGLRGDTPGAQLRADTGDAEFWLWFDSFLRTHGHRSSTREISACRWHE